jgi:hypothetical protein
MTIQYIIDRAQTIEPDRRKVASQSISRSQRVKTVERDSAEPWRFKVTPPAQIDYASSRSVIEVIDMNDRFTEYQISLNNNARMNYITEYQGGLNSGQITALNVTATTTASLVINNLPSIGAAISTSTVSLTAQSFAYANSITYNRALSTSRTDFIVPTTSYDNLLYKPAVGDTLSVATYIVSAQTISSITRNYVTIGGVSYTRFVMSAAPDASSPAATVNNDSDIDITASRTLSVSSSTVVFARGDYIQPINSRYPYTVVDTVVRSTGTSVTVNLHRNIITSEGITLTNAGVLVGNSVTWRVVVTTLPT